MSTLYSDEKELKEKYFKTIDECAAGKINFEIQNGNAEHATYLLRKFFEHGKKRVYIFTGSLYGKVFDSADMIGAARSFLSEAGRELIIAFADKSVTNEEIKNREFVKQVMSDSEKKGDFKLLDARSVVSDVPDLKHFALMDDEAFRLEHYHDRLKPVAVANFGDKKTVELLSSLFASIQINAEQFAV